jgi:DNA-binding IclR family transcriptional regulator
MLKGMAYSDTIVYETLIDLIAQMGSDAIITNATISAASGVPPRTVTRALKRLMNARKIEKNQTPGIGCTYRLP